MIEKPQVTPLPRTQITLTLSDPFRSLHPDTIKVEDDWRNASFFRRMTSSLRRTSILGSPSSRRNSSLFGSPDGGGSRKASFLGSPFKSTAKIAVANTMEQEMPSNLPIGTPILKPIATADVIESTEYQVD